MSSTHIYNKPYCPKPYQPRNPVPEGWVTLKQWILEEAEKQGVGYGAVFKWLRKENRYPEIEIKQINSRVVWVKQPTK